MPYTLQQFGQQVKKKYPNLASKKDEEVAKMVLQQYPEYQSWIQGADAMASDVPQMVDPQLGSVNAQNFGQSSAFEPSASQGGQSSGFATSNAFSSGSMETPKPFWKKALDFVGETTGISGLYGASRKAAGISQASDQVGLDITQQTNALIAEAKKFPSGDPRRMQLLKQAQQVAQAGGVAADALLGAVPKDRQVIGSAGKMALTAASFGLGAPATVGGRLAVGTLTGGAFGAADAAEKGGGLGDIAKSAGIGAATGLAVGGVMEGVRYAATNWAPKQFQRGARFTPTELTDERVQRAIEYGTKQGKVFKSAESAVSFFDKQNNAIEGEIQKKLTAASGKIRPKAIVSKIVDSMNAEGYVTSADEVFGQLVDAVPNGERLLTKTSLSTQEANTLKKAISENINFTPGTWFATLKPGKQKLLQNARYLFAEAVKDSAGQEARDLFEKQMYSIILRDGFQAAADKGVIGGGLVNTGAGAILGGGAGALGIGMGPGAIAGAAATKFLHTTLGRTLAAKGLSQLAPVIAKLAPQEQQLIIQAILGSKKQESK